MNCPKNIIEINEKIIKVNNFNKYISAQFDNNTTQKHFKIKRFWENLDLANFVGWIIAERVDGKIFNIICDISEFNDFLILTWKIDGNVTAIGDDVEVAIKFCDVENNLIWQTAKATFKVYESIDGNEGSEEEYTMDVFEQAIAITANNVIKTKANSDLAEKYSIQTKNDRNEVAAMQEQVEINTEYIQDNADKLEKILQMYGNINGGRI